MERAIDRNFTYMMEYADENEVDLGDIRNKVTILRMAENISNDIEVVTIERAIEGIVDFINYELESAYDIPMYDDSVELFRYM